MKALSRVRQPPQYESYFEQIRDRKHAGDEKTQLVAHSAVVVARYQPFLDAMNGGTLDQLEPMPATPELQDALRSCYGRNKGAEAMKEAIKTAQANGQLKYCPMCGTTLPTTHDHYLPASVFPEFAVHPLNLVPCCAMCNSRKDDDWLNREASRQYLHLYSDTLPAAQFLQAELFESPGFSTVGARFSLVQPDVIEPVTWALITSHFHRLALLDLYTEHANDEIDEMLRACANHVRNGGQDARGFLLDQANDASILWGLNHWRATLMQALARVQRFDELVTAKITRQLRE